MIEILFSIIKIIVTITLVIITVIMAAMIILSLFLGLDCIIEYLLKESYIINKIKKR